MLLLDHIWAKVTTFVGVLTLLPWNDVYIDQIPLQAPIIPASSLGDGPGPVFRPPGTPNASSFVCDYSAMGSNWVACSERDDRGCWLKNTVDGSQFNISTNYEDLMPVGVTRNYKIDLKDSTHDADGLNFTAAKLFALYTDPARKPSDDEYIYPGPWIEACWGDKIVVNVTNSLQYNGTSVHWHGIRQLNTTQMDGVNGVTQCPMAPEDYFVYEFEARQYGSSWYHSHYSVQYADGAAGPMSIHGPTSADFDDDISPPLIMTDWGHNSAFDSVINFNIEQLDILLNGRGNITKFNSSVVPDVEIQPLYNTTVARGSKYLMRLINTSFQTAFVFSIDNHVLTVITADFVPINPYTTNQINIGIGQRYDVIVEANPLPNPPNSDEAPSDGNFWIRTFISDCYGFTVAPNNNYSEAGIFHYSDRDWAIPTTSNWSNITTVCNDEPYERLVPVVPWTVGQASNTPNGEEFAIAGVPAATKPYPLARLELNSTVPKLPIRVDYTDPTFFHLDNTGNWTDIWRVQPEDYDAFDWIYLVIESVGAHPMHLHGHDFAILAQNSTGPYDPSTAILKLDNPPRRDVVTVQNGYVVIAFKADNPGAWMVHCHIAFHIAGGLGMQIVEDREAALALWPNTGDAQIEAHRVCDNWYTWSSNSSNWAPQPRCGDSPEFCFQNDSGV